MNYIIWFYVKEGVIPLLLMKKRKWIESSTALGKSAFEQDFLSVGMTYCRIKFLVGIYMSCIIVKILIFYKFDMTLLQWSLLLYHTVWSDLAFYIWSFTYQILYAVLILLCHVIFILLLLQTVFIMSWIHQDKVEFKERWLET